MIFHDISTFFLMNMGMSFDHLIPSRFLPTTFRCLRMNWTSVQ